MATERYGIFGTSEVDRDENGFVERLAIVQESGLFGGAPPIEMRIYELVPFNDEKFGKQRTAQLNRKTDLPFYLTTVRIKNTGKLVKWIDEMLAKEDIEPLGEE